MDLVSKRELNKGFGDALARAFELVTTPAIFGFFGWLLDERLGTHPVFMLVLSSLVLAYVAWKMWRDYERSMQSHEVKLGIRSVDSSVG